MNLNIGSQQKPIIAKYCQNDISRQILNFQSCLFSTTNAELLNSALLQNQIKCSEAGLAKDSFSNQPHTPHVITYSFYWYEQKGKISLKILKFPSKYHHFSQVFHIPHDTDETACIIALA